MEKSKVAIVGCTGMLGAMTLDLFARDSEHDVIATYRGKTIDERFTSDYPNVEYRRLDAEKADEKDIAAAINGASWVINDIGIIKPYIHDDNSPEIERAVRVNSLFPYLLAKAAVQTEANVIQIATDCVYSGEKGQYVEPDLHDALDVYGKSKSLGEAYFDNDFHLRVSIIGPELKAHLSLMDWFLGQAQGAELNGFTNHQWNGITTLQFAKICRGIISEKLTLPHLQHVVPGNMITKANLLRSMAKGFKRNDIKINDVEAPKVIDRTLSTDNQELNQSIWKAAGYEKPPTIEEMVAEVAKYGFPRKDGK